jgi:hypothetical protein
MCDGPVRDGELRAVGLKAPSFSSADFAWF